jgi:SAM-dependent methyltransferase
VKASSSLRQRLWQAWQRSWFWPARLERHLLYRSLLHAKKYASGDLLDVGCGPKPYGSLFADQVVRYIGVDYPLTLGTLEPMAQGNPDVFADAVFLPFRDGCFDTVLCTQVLEHVSRPWVVLEEIARVLQPSGVLIITVPQEWGIHTAPYDFYRFTRYGLAYLAQRSGLHVEYLRPRGGFWAMMGQRASGYLDHVFLRPLRSRHKLLFVACAGILLGVCAVAQLLGLVLDRIQPLERNTLGYLMIARKPRELVS